MTDTTVYAYYSVMIYTDSSAKNLEGITLTIYGPGGFSRTIKPSDSYAGER